MATEIQPRTLEAENSDALIHAQLQRTRSQVKGVEFGQRFLKLIVGVLAFFLVATLLDHWVVSEGLPIWARVVLWLALFGGILWYAARALLPLLLYKVNPLYAARTIEETKPSLKNSLINYLTLRSEQDRLPSVIYDAIAKQAASGVKDASVDHAVDHAPLIRWGYLLLGLMFCFALYFVVSPKNPFRTVARVVVPWADLTAPSRVQIVEVTPGSVQLYRGKTVKIAARIDGLDEEETATLFYTTADGQQREQPIPLQLDDLREYTTLLPAPAEKAAGAAAAPRELAGLQQDFEYYITAGDARSKTFRVQVAPAPYIGVERIEYKYPAYTKRAPETRQGEVDIQALEGTTVTIHGTANQPLKRAWIELRDNTGKPQKFPEMKINDMFASGSWTLGLKDGAREFPDFASYALRFRNQQGDDNPEPIAYPIKVIRDEAPTIDFLAPTSAEITVPWDQPITFEVRAQDPDFALIEVQLLGMRGDKIAFTQNIASFAAANAFAGNLQKKLSISPEKLGLQVGDVIDYWATATDNKVPNPNIAQTTQRRLRVIEAQKNRNPNDDPLAKNQPPQNQQQNQPQDKNQQRDPNQQGQPGDQQPPNNDPKQQPMGNQGQDANNPNAQGQPQQPNDPTNLNNQDPNNQRPNGDQRQQPNQNSGQQNNQPQDPNQKNPPQNPDNKNQQPQPNGGDAGKSGEQKNDSKQGDKSGEPQPNKGQQPNNSSKQNGDQKNDPMNGAGQAQPQQGNQGQEPNDKQDDGKNSPTKSGENGKQNPQSGGQPGKPEQNQQAGRPQEQNNKVNSDGSEDGDAIQRLKEYFEKNQKPSEQQANNQPNQGQQQPQDSKQQTGKQEPGKQEPGKQDQGKQEPGKQSEPSQQSSGKQEAGKEQNGKQDPSKQQALKEGGQQPGQSSPSKEPSTQQNGNNNSGEAGKQESGKQPPSNNGKQAPSNDGKQPNGQTGDQKQTDPMQSGQKQTGEQSPNAGQKSDPMNSQKQPGPSDQTGEKQAGKAGAGEKQEPGEKADQGAKPDPNGKQPGDMGQDGNRQNPEKNQPGANAKDPNSQGSKDGNATEPENRQSPKNDQQQQTGKSDPNGSPEAQKKGKPNDNASNSNPDGKNNKAESPSNQGNDSASKGEEGGDRNGGGKKGDGQQENQAGRGAAGSNTEDEKGANAGKQQGDGETGSKAGNQQKSNGQTGKSGKEQGNGTERKPGDGKQPGGQPGQNAPEGQANEPGKEPGEPGGQPSGQTGNPREQKQQKNGPAGNMPGGGGNSDAPAIPPQGNDPLGEAPDEKINEDYAKRATDLVLDKMQKQLRSGDVDQDLLNKLGWTKEDAQRFVDRWETLKREAQQPGPAGNAAAAKLQEKLRSLGLRPQQSSNTGDNVADDTQRGNRVNRRSAPPSEYRDIYRAFQKGASGG